MELHEYPRPANDTGIGIHWSAGYAAAVGLGKIRDFWLPEIKAMGVKWVKIYNHDGALDFAELLLAEGIMPIVRLYRPTPNPGHLGVKDLVHLDAFIQAGVRYIEFNNEPDRDSEWRGGRVPANGIDIVVEDTIADMETILERGGLPGIPAVSSGSRWDLMGKIIETGRRDLLDGPIWQAIHNYSYNRPLDYPYDIGNQEGAAYTQRFYQTVASERWNGDAWQGRPLAEINRLRLNHSNPGATIMDDAACWLAYEYFDARIRKHLGRSIPILSTENGYLVGEDTDARYPATTPDLHLAQTLEACRIMMGSSNRFKPAIDAYFCTSFALIANFELGSSSSWWEEWAWYSDRWPDGSLPIVKALRAEPKVLRRWQNEDVIGTRAALYGTVRQAHQHRIVVVEQNGLEKARATLDENNRYWVPDLAPGSYTVRIEGTDLLEAVTLNPGQGDVVLDFDLSAHSEGASESIVTGRIRGGAGAVVMLLRTDDGNEWVSMAQDDGTVRFIDLPAGIYNARVHPEGSRVEGIQLNGRNHEEIELAVYGWGYSVQWIPSEQGEEVQIESTDTGTSSIGLIRCAVEGHRDMLVYAQSGEWRSDPVRTGSATQYGQFACEIDLQSHSREKGSDYLVSVEGVVNNEGSPVQLEAQVRVDRSQSDNGQIPFVQFIYNPPITEEIATHSVVGGRVIGSIGTGRETRVILSDSQAHQQIEVVDEEGGFFFEELGPGRYTLFVDGHTNIDSRADVALDGSNRVFIELSIPYKPSSTESFATPVPHITGNSRITGTAPGGAGRIARLIDTLGNEFASVVTMEERFDFEGLAAGLYRLGVEGGYEQTGLELDGDNSLEVFFSPLVTHWISEIHSVGSMPGFSAIRVDVEGLEGLQVFLSKQDWPGMAGWTGSRPDLGRFSLEFSPLEPGYYIVEPEGLNVHADVELTGLEALWVNFRQQTVPVETHVVVELGKDIRDTSSEIEDVEEIDAPEDSFAVNRTEENVLERPLDVTIRDSTELSDNLDLPGALYGESNQGFEQLEDRNSTSSSLSSNPETYLFIGTTLDSVGIHSPKDLIAILDYASTRQPLIGSDVEVAAQAKRVILVGIADPNLIETLRANNVDVVELSGDLTEVLSRL